MLAALQVALRYLHPQRRLLNHGDRGVHYACAEHRAVLVKADLAATMGSAA